MAKSKQEEKPVFDEEEEQDDDFVPEDDHASDDDEIVEDEENDTTAENMTENDNAKSSATLQEDEPTMEEKIQKILQNKVAPTTLATKEDDLVYDLGHLCAIDTHDIDMQEYKKQSKDYLLQVSRENVQLLIEKMFALPSQGEDEGLFVEMPDSKTRLPREKPAPKPAAPSRFEQFVKDKGLKIRQKEKLVYDEVTDSYKPRAGRGRANDIHSQFIIPAKDTDLPGSDPFIELKHKQKEKLYKQKGQELANERRGLKKNKIPGQVSIANANRLFAKDTKMTQKNEMKSTYDIARFSTASMGKFDRKLGLEPKKNEVKTSRKRKYDEAMSTSQVSSFEKDTAKSVLNRVLKVEQARKQQVLNQSAKIYQKVSEKDKRAQKKVHALASNKERFAKKRKLNPQE